MEKQRSFSIKRTRFLVFSFTVCLGLIFLVFFSIWVIKLSPFPQETHIELNTANFLSLGSMPFIAQTSLGSKDPILGSAQENKGNVAAGEVNGNFTVTANTNLLKFGKSPEFSANESENSENCGKSVYTSVNCNVKQENVSSASTLSKEISLIEKKEEKNGGVVCDMTNGKWVFDEMHPLYTNVSCPYIDEGFNCQTNGRTDKDYMKWRWQPQNCNIPRFNATHMLELMRGKRLVFVGDSINRNQWESMLCLLMGAVKDQKKVYETRGRRITKGKGSYSFKFVDYKCTVEFYVTHFLVREGKVRMGKKRRQTLRIDAIDKGSSRWRGADILVFNTAHWWSHHKTKAGINYYQEGDQVHGHLDILMAYERALMTWALWVDTHINPAKTRVFFRTSSPSHYSGGQWNNGGHCREASRPLREGESYDSYFEKNTIMEKVTKEMKTPVTVLNITGLSGYRIDGHPSVYGRRQSEGSNYSEFQDCSHWCLPGVPDTWNQILYYYIQLAPKQR
ncbi:unnamed protein product [Cuscuta europaea]|uniref:Trichome birefringence-like N-terminal domain-containing protein n=1 Tax=Cuscuta europaea TaxID=41803 RepID=A0A9P1E002_CUSEU|nr:unnamed protein product [Cuscuta europaea]